MHDLLHHLERVGFEGSSRVLGIHERGREILAYIEGEVGTLSPEGPLPEWFRRDEACWAIGRWIREFQASQQGFVPDPTKPWRRASGAPLKPGQVIVHHDVSPYNTVRRPDGTLVVLDWHFARPGEPLDDLAWAAWRWVPLMTGSWWRTEYGVGHLTEDELLELQERHLRALLDGYGASPDQRRDLGDAITAQLESHAADLKEMATTDPAFAALVERDYARGPRRRPMVANRPSPAERAHRLLEVIVPGHVAVGATSRIAHIDLAWFRPNPVTCGDARGSAG